MYKPHDPALVHAYSRNIMRKCHFQQFMSFIKFNRYVNRLASRVRPHMALVAL
jgi:hypothetical protein